MAAVRSQIFETRTWLVGLLAATTACAIGFPAGRKKVTDVQITGAEPLDESKIADGLANHPPRGLVFRKYAPYEELALEVDQRRIASYLKRRGYFTPRVSEGEAIVGASEVEVRYEVEPGPPTIVEDVRIVVTSTAVDEAAAVALSRIVVGERFEYDDYEATKAVLAGWLNDLGRPRGSVSGRVAVDRDEHLARIEITIDPGPRVYFDAVEIEPASLPKESVENRISWQKGDPFEPSKMKITEGRLYSLELVGSVRYTPKFHSDDEKIDLRIELSETSKNELKLGGGVELDPSGWGVNGRVGYTRRDFFDPLTTLRLNLRPRLQLLSNGRAFGVQVNANADVDRDDFLYPRLKLTTGVAYRLVTYEAYFTQGPSARVTVGRPFLDDRLKFSFGVSAALYQVEPFDDLMAKPDAIGTFGAETPLPLIFGGPSVTFDGRDNPLSPHSGWYASLPVEFGRSFTGTGASYLKVTPELQGYLPIFTPRIVLAGRARFGANLLDKPLPITQRYFAGGSDSQRGFGRRQLSPGIEELPDPDDPTAPRRYLPLGAEAMFIANAELRFEIVKLLGEWFGVVGFVDVGDAENSVPDLQFDNPHLAAGGGLRYQTPVGPLRIDVGYRINRFDGDVPRPIGSGVLGRLRLHISIGEAF